MKTMLRLLNKNILEILKNIFVVLTDKYICGIKKKYN